MSAVIFDALADHLQHAQHRELDAAVKMTGGEDRRIGVLLQVLADTRYGVDEVDPMRLEFTGIADAGKHQHLRRIEGTRGNDHLALGLDRTALALVVDGNADRPLALEFDAYDVSPGHDSQIVAVHRRMQVGHSRAATPAVRNGKL